MGRSRVCSSWMWATRPGSRAIMKNVLASADGIPRSTSTAAMAEAGQPLARAAVGLDHPGGGLGEGLALVLGRFQALLDDLHAGFDRAAVVLVDAQQSGRAVDFLRPTSRDFPFTVQCSG